MIAAYQKNFIFIKTQKTGGTSVEIALSAACSGADIVTTVSPEDELLRHESGAQPRNFTKDPQLEHRFLDAIRKGDLATIEKMRKREIVSPYYNHMSAMEVQKLLPDLWQKSFKFTIERHPYDRAVSMAWWRTRGRPDKVTAALNDVPNDVTFPNYPKYFDGRTVLVDKIVEYLKLADELSALAEKLHLNWVGLPRAKGNFRMDDRPAIDVLTREQKGRIYEVTAPEFEIMGYER